MLEKFRNNNERSINTRGGTGNFNNTGDYPIFGDVTFQLPKPKTLNRTVLYEFCKQFSESTLPEPTTDEEKKLPSGISEKMQYNEISVYKKVFKSCDIYLDDVEDILNQIPKRESIIRKIERLYDHTKIEKKWDDKDQLCKIVFDTLFESVSNDPQSSHLYDEDAELAIEVLMYYAFTKCKLLDPVPKK
ncbi:hypothetical protein [Lysinibacillus xylanilyticus]|uniref:hypothetical protein n=1 Tax=Lysinibacillus xylanilyticus TaxID=582475 RepID=UPI003D01079F